MFVKEIIFAVLAVEGVKNTGQKLVTDSNGGTTLVDVVSDQDAVALATLASSLLGIVYLASAPIINFISRRLHPPTTRKATTVQEQLQELESLVQLNDTKAAVLNGSATSLEQTPANRIVSSRAMDIWDSEKENWRRRRGNIIAAEERDRMESGGGRKRHQRCVGRKVELERCKTIVQGLLSSKEDDIVQGKCIYFEGPSGIGKSTLAQSFLNHLRDLNAHVASASSIARSHFEAYSTLSELLISCFPNVPSPEQFPVPSDLAEQRRHYFEALCSDDAEIKELLPLLNPMIWTGRPADYFTRAVESQPGCIKQMVKVFLKLAGKAFADRFLVLFVDDYQNCDLMSMSFLNDLITDSTRRHLRLLIVTCATFNSSISSQFDMTPARDLSSLPHTTRITLKPLTDSDSKELIRATLGRGGEQTGLESQIKRIVEEAAGVPLLLTRAGEALRRSNAGDITSPSLRRNASRKGGNNEGGLGRARTLREGPQRSASGNSLDRTEVGSVTGRKGYGSQDGDEGMESSGSGDVSECVIEMRESVTSNDTKSLQNEPPTDDITSSPFISAHLTQLWTEETDYLKLCASLGDTFFEVELLFHVFVRLFPANRMPQLLASLEQLERRGFLIFKRRPTRLGGAVEGYGFDHHSTWALLQSKVDPEQHRTIQQLIAEWYENQLPPSVSGSAVVTSPISPGGGGEKVAGNVTAAAGTHSAAAGMTTGCPTVASLLELGGMHKKAALYYIMAAEGDVRRYCGRTAAECLHRVVEMTRSLDRETHEETISDTVWTRIEYLFSIAFLQAGQVDQSIGYAEKALERLKNEEDRLMLGPRASLAKEFALAALGWRLPRLFLRWDHAESTYQEGALLKNIWLVKVFSELNRTSSLIMTLYTVNILETYYRSTQELLISYGHLVYALGLFRNMRHLQKIYIDRARVVARELTDLYAAVEYQTFIAYSSISQGHFDKGIQQLRAAMDVANKLPNHERTYLYPYLFHLTALYYQGQFTTALAELERHIQPYIERLGGDDSHMGQMQRAFLLELNLHLREGFDTIAVYHYPKILELVEKFRLHGTGSVLEFRILARAGLFAAIMGNTKDARTLLALVFEKYLPAERGQFMVLYGLAVSSCVEAVLRLRALLSNEQGKGLEETYWYLHKVMQSCCELYPFMRAELGLYEAVYAFIHSKEDKAKEAIGLSLTEARKYGMKFQEGLISAHATEMFANIITNAQPSANGTNGGGANGEGSYGGGMLGDIALADHQAIAAELGCVYHILPLKRKFWWGLWGLQKKASALLPADL
ncbi:hypothetical protein HDV00_000343 [Rhizophlyctis rosea]|nr:hypothetical protein HDV00_000343 [Rhizophlyctis rosea]